MTRFTLGDIGDELSKKNIPMLPEASEGHIEWEVVSIDTETELDEIVRHLEEEYSSHLSNNPSMVAKRMALGRLSDDKLYYRILGY